MFLTLHRKLTKHEPNSKCARLVSVLCSSAPTSNCC